MRDRAKRSFRAENQTQHAIPKLEMYARKLTLKPKNDIFGPKFLTLTPYKENPTRRKTLISCRFSPSNVSQSLNH